MRSLPSVVLIGSLILLASCASTPSGPAPTFNVQVTADTPVEIQVAAIASYGRNFLYGDGLAGFGVSVSNNTGKMARVNWEKSSVITNGTSSPPFISGMKYKDAGTTPPPLMVPSGGKISVDVFSASQPYYTGGQYATWIMQNIKTQKAQLIICVESEGKEIYFTVDATLSAP